MIARACLLACSLTAMPLPAAGAAALDYGPHAVGFRTFDTLDRSRTMHARATFDGRAIDGDPSMPLRIAVWYPAEPSSASLPRLTTFDYQRVSRGPVRDRDAIVNDWKRMLGFIEVHPSDADLQQALGTPRRAARDATPLAGRHPLIVGGMEAPSSSAALGEYLASHGYVVITAPSLMRTATEQATVPLVALETQTRNMEYLLAVAHDLPFADDSRLAVLGVNFDGMAALNFEMRNMRASAVVSVDGWEGKQNGAATLRESPYFDPVRLRVPYLVFEQDEPDIAPALGHSRMVFDSLKYSARQWYVLGGFGHLLLTTDQTTAPGLPEGARDGYAFLYATIREFLDSHVRKAAQAQARPVSRIKEQFAGAPLLPAPTAEEFEQLVMDGPIDRAVAVFRRAHADNPDLVVAGEGTLNLFAFRFGQRQDGATVRALRELTAEAFPSSARAAYNLAVARMDLGAPNARAAFERALTLLDTDSSLPQGEKDRLRADIRQRMAR